MLLSLRLFVHSCRYADAALVSHYSILFYCESH